MFSYYKAFVYCYFSTLKKKKVKEEKRRGEEKEETKLQHLKDITLSKKPQTYIK